MLPISYQNKQPPLGGTAPVSEHSIEPRSKLKHLNQPWSVRYLYYQDQPGKLLVITDYVPDVEQSPKTNITRNQSKFISGCNESCKASLITSGDCWHFDGRQDPQKVPFSGVVLTSHSQDPQELEPLYHILAYRVSPTDFQPDLKTTE